MSPWDRNGEGYLFFDDKSTTPDLWIDRIVPPRTVSLVRLP